MLDRRGDPAEYLSDVREQLVSNVERGLRYILTRRVFRLLS